MIWIVAVAFLLTGTLIGGAVYWGARRVSPLIKKSVRVHTRDRRSIEGVLVKSYPTSLVLRHARYLTEADPNGLGSAMAGDVVVERSNVSFIQEVEPRPSVSLAAVREESA